MKTYGLRRQPVQSHGWRISAKTEHTRWVTHLPSLHPTGHVSGTFQTLREPKSHRLLTKMAQGQSPAAVATRYWYLPPQYLQMISGKLAVTFFGAGLMHIRCRNNYRWPPLWANQTTFIYVSLLRLPKWVCHSTILTARLDDWLLSNACKKVTISDRSKRTQRLNAVHKTGGHHCTFDMRLLSEY